MSARTVKIEKCEDNGFIYNYCSPKSGDAPENVVFILHGADTNVDRWSRRIKQMHRSMPNTAVIAVQGNIEGNSKKHNDPKVAEKGEKVYRWLKRGNAVQFVTSVIKDKLFGHSTSKKVEKFIDAKLSDLNLTADKSAVIGNSMGGVASVNSHIRRKNPYGAYVLQASGVMTARPLTQRVKTAFGKFVRAVTPVKKARKSLTEQFNLSAAPREVRIAMMNRDNIFDTRGREADKKAKGKSNFISQAISNVYSSMFGREETVKRLERAGVDVVSKVYNTLPKSNYNRHKVTDTMWFDDIAYVAEKTGAKYDVVEAEKTMKPWAAKKRKFNSSVNSLMACYKFAITRKEAEKRIKEADVFNKAPKMRV